jgi:WD40 repeat protein
MVPEAKKNPRYDAFISYSHKADAALAKALENQLETFAKPWYRLRSANIFRDETALTPNPHLWPTIVRHLDDSAFLIVLASRTAAESKWVRKELCHWISNGACDEPDSLVRSQIVRDKVARIIILLTDGDIAWSDAAFDFNWSATTALPRTVLAEAFSGEPLWIDLRWTRAERCNALDRSNDDFLRAIARISAPLRNLDIESLIGEDYRQHRKALSLFRRLSIGLAIGFILAVIAGAIAWRQTAIAVQRERHARHQEGIGWLARSAVSERGKDYLAAKLMAMKAIGFDRYGPVDGPNQDLLLPESAQYSEAVRRIVALQEANLLFAISLGTAATSPDAQCAFNKMGTLVTAFSNKGPFIALDLGSGKLSRADDFSDRRGIPPDSRVEQIHLGNNSAVVTTATYRAEIVLNGREGTVVWSDPNGSTRKIVHKIPEDALWKEENDDDPEITGISFSRNAPIVFAIIQNRYVQSVVACQQSHMPVVVFEASGEISGDSAVIQAKSTALSSDGSIAAVSTSDGALTVYRKADRGAYIQKHQQLVDHADIGVMAISDDNRLCAGAIGRTIHVWDLTAMRQVATLTAHADDISDIDFSPDGRSMVSMSRDGVILVWSLPRPAIELISLDGVPKQVRVRLLGSRSGKQHSTNGDLVAVSPKQDLTATWNSYTAYPGIADSFVYGHLRLSDTETKTKVSEAKFTDAGTFDGSWFSESGRFLVLSEEGRDIAIVPIHCPRQWINYEAAYESLFFTDAGVQLGEPPRIDEPVQFPLPANFSSISLAQDIPIEDLTDALKWYYGAVGVHTFDRHGAPAAGSHGNHK